MSDITWFRHVVKTSPNTVIILSRVARSRAQACDPRGPQHPRGPEEQGSGGGRADDEPATEAADRARRQQTERGGATGRHDGDAAGRRLVQEEQVKGVRVPRPAPVTLLLHPFDPIRLSGKGI